MSDDHRDEEAEDDVAEDAEDADDQRGSIRPEVLREFS
jgi:hypothetical protein